MLRVVAGLHAIAPGACHVVVSSGTVGAAAWDDTLKVESWSWLGTCKFVPAAAPLQEVSSAD